MWCIGCNSKNLSKKKIVILASIVATAAVVLYYSFTINSVIALAVLPFLLPFLGCIIMCGVMSGAMFLSNRFSKRSSKKVHHSCGMGESEKINESISTTDEPNIHNKKIFKQ